MSRLTEFKKYIKGKQSAVVGIGVSNTPLIDFLLSCGAVVTARDIKTREKLGELADTLEQKGVSLLLGDGYLENLTEDIIFKAPGIRGDLPQFATAVKRGAVLTSEMEVFFELCPCKIFGITGSDGKTTTTTLTYKMLELEAKKRGSSAKVWVGGNIGKPLLPEIDSFKADDIAVVELSSFQLHMMKRSPFAAAITNVSPNHLNWHTDMEEYTVSKENIFKNPGNTRVVLNYGCELTREMAALTNSEVTYFSGSLTPADGYASVYERDGIIVYREADGSVTEVLRQADIKIPGRHNVENYMTAIALTHGFVSREVICEIARTFGGVEHRCEFVREADGVKYYNSSIDSSPTRTEAALRAFKEKVIVICGGYDKNIPYEPLAKPLCDCAKKVVLVGATAPKIKEALLAFPEYNGTPEIIEADSFEAAVKAARDAANAGDIVILSPASASFDMFKNFEERGNYFKAIVHGF
ncbi:MAG: UDP-N-acetylmuramoyl-L-alanine--D-glutamate ligase [Clostridia bacterium]|nr:UDP-N-acetylmuramoyl-L-alanine--D-glutamate ligase [Clostridia bacterium]